MLPSEAQEVLDKEVVLIVSRADTKQGDYYPHEQFIASMQGATLDRLAATIPENATGRQVHQAMAAMRTEAAHKAVLQEAITRLQQGGTVVAVDADQRVVACFTGT